MPKRSPRNPGAISAHPPKSKSNPSIPSAVGKMPRVQFAANAENNANSCPRTNHTPQTTPAKQINPSHHPASTPHQSNIPSNSIPNESSNIPFITPPCYAKAKNKEDNTRNPTKPDPQNDREKRMNTRQIYAEIARTLAKGEPIAQATVIETKGSTPRKSGSLMLVHRNGTLSGTIGGGCGEADVIRTAKLALQDGLPRQVQADLTEDISREAEGVCGGTLEVFIEPWQPRHLALAKALTAHHDGNQHVIMHQVIDGSPATLRGARLLTDAQGRILEDPHHLQEHLPEYPFNDANPSSSAPAAASSVPSNPGEEPPRLRTITKQRADQHAEQDTKQNAKQDANWKVYTEHWTPQPQLLIVGAGHIAEPLEAFARACSFATTVIDDRRLYANRERFPQAERVVCGPILEVMQQIALSTQSYVVLVTRGHTLDLDALKVLIERPEKPAYVGMIGSKRRIAAVFTLLDEEGYPQDRFAHVRAPIGLSIGAETPEEIAVCIAAELIAVRRQAGSDNRPLSLLSRQERRRSQQEVASPA